VHRDLKPANIMLGDYGEVYVLDWGLARAINEPEGPAATGVSSLGGETQLGAVMGTPGYMSPEQLRGEVVGPSTDIYALGSILFEILTRQPLHPRGQPAVAATLAGGVLSPAERAPERQIAPELDALCRDALAETADKRPTAKVLAEGIQRYLDGDRDLEQRRTLAAKLLDSATADHDSGDPARRASAMTAAGRALALDQESEGAAALVSRLMIEPPKELPAALVQRFDTLDREQITTQARLAVISLSSYFTFIPILLWMGVRDWTVMAVTFVLIVLAIALAAAMVKGRRIPMWLTMVVNAAALAVMSQLTSPFLMLPGMVAGSAVSFTTIPQLMNRPAVVVGTFGAAIVVPVILEALGVLPSTWAVRDGTYIAQPYAITFDGTSASVFLVAGSLAILVVLSQFVRSLAIKQRDGRRQLEMQAWHLGQLIRPARA